MRSEEEILELILSTAREDERVRVVVMNGSRANPNARRDIFQDFDIVYFVTEMAPYIKNLEWVARFGETIVMQMPEDMEDPPPEDNGWFGYLLQFRDGNRIDLGICPIEQMADSLSDSLSILLLDKDGRVPPFPPPSERGYLPHPPTAKTFADSCNEFWWVSLYVGKGLWREELPYARNMLDVVVRDQFDKMLTWLIGTRSAYAVNPGKNGKYFQRYLAPEEWQQLLRTYADGSYEHTWEALFAMCDLFRAAALEVAGCLGLDYNHGEDERASAHLRHVRALPKDAQEVY